MSGYEIPVAGAPACVKDECVAYRAAAESRVRRLDRISKYARHMPECRALYYHQPPCQNECCDRVGPCSCGLTTAIQALSS